MEETTSDEYVRRMVRCGAMYLWYYVYRPVGPDPSPGVVRRAGADDRAAAAAPGGMRRRTSDHPHRHLLERRRQGGLPGAAWGWDFTSARRGASSHVRRCPRPARRSATTITIFSARSTRAGSCTEFQDFVKERTRGCVILEHPQALAEYLGRQSAVDYSGRDLLGELAAAAPADEPSSARRRNPRGLLGLSDAEEAAFFRHGRVWVSGRERTEFATKARSAGEKSGVRS